MCIRDRYNAGTPSGTGSGNVIVGYIASISANVSDAISIGNSCATRGTDSIGIGAGVNVQSIDCTVIGRSATVGTSNPNCVIVGKSSSVTTSVSGNCTIVGTSCTTVGSNSTALGYNAVTTASNQVRIGNASVTSIGGYADWSNISDGRIKKNVTEDVLGLSFISQLRPITYDKDYDAIAQITGRAVEPPEVCPREIGLIAQEVETVAQSLNFNFPGVCPPTGDGDTYMLTYSALIMPLIKAVQEQQVLIQTMKAEIQALQAMNPA